MPTVSCVLSDIADVHYCVDQKYDPNDNFGILWNDSDINIAFTRRKPLNIGKGRTVSYLERGKGFSNWWQMNILLTGATGNIGQHLISKLTKAGYSIICQSRKVKDANQKSGTWVQHDLNKNSWSIINSYKIDVVIHLAAQTSAYKSNTEPVNDLVSNVVGPLKLIDYFKNNYSVPPFFINISTATVVGMAEKMPINETVEVSPTTFYDLSKLTMENYLDQCISHGFIKGCSLRLSNVYGVSLTSGIKDRSILDRIIKQQKMVMSLRLWVMEII